MTTLRNLLLASGLALSAAHAASAENYRLSMWVPDSEPTAKANMLFAEDLAKATNGDLTFQYFGGGVVMPPAAHLQGIADGVVEAGQVTTGYSPKDLPLNNAVGAFGFIESDPTTIGAAYADWMMHDPGSVAEWDALGIVPVAGFSTANYQLICNTSEPITELAQMQGLKVRSYGQIGKLVADLGGVPVAIPGSEAYQALQTGALDCASFAANYLMGQKLVEVSKATTMVNWNPAFNAPQLSFNKDFWKGLTNDQRALIFKLAARAHARAQHFYNEDASNALEAVKARGYQIVEPGETLK